MPEPPPLPWSRHPAVRPYTRWTAETEQAFLLALGLTGQPTKAAEAIGRSLATAYKKRQRDPGFAARWDAVVAEQQAGWIAERGEVAETDPLRGHRQRFDGWNAARRKLFLRVLSETGSVRDACARGRVSSTSAYRLRDKCPRFRADWERALETRAVTLEQAAYERAVEGWEEPVISGGQVVATRRRYSDTLLHLLLRQAQARERGEAGPTPIDFDAAREEILSKIDAIEQTEARTLARRGGTQWQRWQRGWAQRAARGVGAGETGEEGDG